MAKTVLDELFIPLEIISHGEIRGKVRLQKLVFIAQTRLEKKYDYDFEPAPLGPLSNHLNYLLGRMNELGIIEENIKTTMSGNHVYCYKITKNGEEILSAIKKQRSKNEKEIETVNSVYEKYADMPYMKLLDFIHKKHPEYHLKGIKI